MTHQSQNLIGQLLQKSHDENRLKKGPLRMLPRIFDQLLIPQFLIIGDAIIGDARPYTRPPVEQMKAELQMPSTFSTIIRF